MADQTSDDIAGPVRPLESSEVKKIKTDDANQVEPIKVEIYHDKGDDNAEQKVVNSETKEAACSAPVAHKTKNTCDAPCRSRGEFWRR